MGKQESEKTVTGSDGSGRYERKALIDKLYETQELSREEWIRLIEGRTPELSQYLFEKARAVREREYGKAVYIRGLIECSNYCRNNCYYCGIRRGNQNAQRYRLTADEILSCCENGYSLGFRTFVLQGGEDPAMTDGWVADVIRRIKKEFPDCAVTLSLGEKVKQHTSVYSTREPTGTFSGMRRPMQTITASFIRTVCHWLTEWSA